MTTESLISATRRLTIPQRREVLARLWAEDDLSEAGNIWKSVKFSSNLRVAAYSPGQDEFIGALRELLQKGALARVENEKDGTYEIYGADRTFYVTMTVEREFAALLDSWLPEEPPREIKLEDIS